MSTVRLLGQAQVEEVQEQVVVEVVVVQELEEVLELEEVVVLGLEEVELGQEGEQDLAQELVQEQAVVLWSACP